MKILKRTFQERFFWARKIIINKTNPPTNNFLYFLKKAVFLIFLKNATSIFWEMEHSIPKMENF